MKLNKRALIATVSVLAVVGSTAVMSNSATAAPKVTTIDYWLWQDNATDQTWQDLANQFNSKFPRVQVKLQVIPLAQFQDKLATSLASGSGPDAARFKDAWIGAYVKNKLIVPLSSKISKWGLSGNVISTAWEAGKVPGDKEIYMMPHQNVAIYMYYNKALFRDAGLNAPKTQNDVLAAAPKLTGNGKYAMDIRGGGGGQDQWAAWMLAGGAKFTNDAGDITIDDAIAVGVNQKYLDLNEYAPPGSSTASFAQVKSNFLAGTTAMMIHHSGSLVEMRAKWGNDLGVIQIPSVDPLKPATLQAMSGNIVLSSSRKENAAFQWISWLLQPGALYTLSNSPQGQLAVTKTVAAMMAKGKDPGFKVALNASKNAESWPRLVGTTTVTAAIWAPTLQDAFAKKITSAEALKKLAAELAKK